MPPIGVICAWLPRDFNEMPAGRAPQEQRREQHAEQRRISVRGRSISDAISVGSATS
jgi:hypothetical protein